MKIAVAGGVGAGKSTEAALLSRESGIPVYAGDAIAHGYASEDVSTENGRFRRTPEEERELIDAILAEPDWIWEGVRREEQERFYAEADVILLLDFPFPVRAERIVRRLLLSALGIRHLPYPTTFSEQLRWTKTYSSETEIPAEYRTKVLPIRTNRDLKRARKEILDNRK